MTIFLDLDGTLLDHDAAERSAAIEFFAAFQEHFRQWSAGEFATLWQAVGRERFDPVVISGEFGIRKPAAGIFHEACRRANCSPRDSVYVGDRLETDAIAGRRAVLHGVWIDRNGSGSAVEGVGLISSLVELPEYVERIEKALVNGALHRAGTGGRAAVSAWSDGD